MLFLICASYLFRIQTVYFGGSDLSSFELLVHQSLHHFWIVVCLTGLYFICMMAFRYLEKSLIRVYLLVTYINWLEESSMPVGLIGFYFLSWIDLVNAIIMSLSSLSFCLMKRQYSISRSWFWNSHFRS